MEMVGCVPQVRAVDTAGVCAKGLNQLTTGFDVVLKSLMASLAVATRLPGLTYSLADSFGLTQATFVDPQASGDTDVASPARAAATAG
jgi:hypothetical protein